MKPLSGVAVGSSAVFPICLEQGEKMKSFWKLMMGGLLAILCMMSFAFVQAAGREPLTDEQKANNLRDGSYRNFMQIFPYMPIDAKKIVEREGRCDKRFNEVNSADAGRCTRYYSKQEGTMWTIRLDGSTVLPERIGRWGNNKPVLWATFLATFDPTEKNGVRYASPEAQKYARTYSDRIAIALSAQGALQTKSTQPSSSRPNNRSQSELLDEKCAIASNSKSSQTIAECRIYRPGSPGSEKNRRAGSPGGDDVSAPPPPADTSLENVVKKGIGDLLKGFGQ